MTRIGNLSYYIKNNQICAAEHSHNDEIIECCFFSVENLALEADQGIVKFHIHSKNIYREHHLHAHSIDDAKKFVASVYYEIQKL